MEQERLVVDVIRIENIVICKILEQPESIKRGCGLVYTRKELGILPREIRSECYPDLDETTLWLEGTGVGAYEVLSMYFKDTDSAIEYVVHLKTLIEEYNKTLGTPSTPADGIVIHREVVGNA